MFVLPAVLARNRDGQASNTLLYYNNTTIKLIAVLQLYYISVDKRGREVTCMVRKEGDLLPEVVNIDMILSLAY